MVQLEALQLNAVVLPSLDVEANGARPERLEIWREREDVRSLCHVQGFEGPEVDGEPDGDVASSRMRTQCEPQVGEVQDRELEAR